MTPIGSPPIMNTVIKIPESTRKRLVQLSQILETWQNEKITSVAISESTGWKSSLIRHDLWLIGFNNGVSNGYYTKDLLNAINVKLGLETSRENNQLENSKDAGTVNSVVSDSSGSRHKNVCIVGLGRIGAALLDQNLTGDSPFTIKTGFDSNVNRVEILRSSFPLYPANEMQFVIKSEKIEYAILTVPDKDAQLMTDRLVKAGIKGIVNMTNVMLKVPEHINIENISILNALKLVI